MAEMQHLDETLLVKDLVVDGNRGVYQLTHPDRLRSTFAMRGNRRSKST